MTDLILPLEKQVSTLESSKILNELGVPQRSLFYWTIGDNYFIAQSRLNGLGYSAFTVAELGELLPPQYYGSKSFTTPHIHYSYYKNELMPFTLGTEAEARAKMLIYLIKNKLMEVPK